MIKNIAYFLFFSHFYANFSLARLHHYENVEKAIEYYNICLQLEPQDAATHYLLGILYYENNDLHEAFQRFQSASKECKESGEFHIGGESCDFKEKSQKYLNVICKVNFENFLSILFHSDTRKIFHF